MTESAATDRVEQYKAYIADLGNIGTRHSQTNTLYMSIISALLVFLALVNPGNGVASVDAVGQITISILGILLCAMRFAYVSSFGHLFKAKFDVLREMEQELPYKCYEREIALLDKGFYRFSSLERGLSVILALPFLIQLVYSLLG